MNFNGSRSGNQRQPFRPSASNATGVREVSKAAKAAIDSEVPKESLEEAIARLTDEANNARMTTSDVGRAPGCLGVALSLVGVIVAAIFW